MTFNNLHVGITIQIFHGKQLENKGENTGWAAAPRPASLRLALPTI